MRKFHDIDQNSDEWFDIRMGFITSSHFGTIMSNYGKAFGNPAKQYAMRVALEGQTKRQIEGYQNEWMQRGIELEDDARQMYSDLTFADVTNGGFMQFGAFGSSSDGLTDEGMIEIKCPKYSTHMERIIKGGIDPTYQWQMIGQMYIYDRPWVDFVSYSPDFPISKQIHIARLERDHEHERVLVTRLNGFAQLVESYKDHLK